MNNDPHIKPQRENIDLEDYLRGAAEASNRTRAVMIAIVVASVLAFVSFLNTMNLKLPWSKENDSSKNVELKSWKLARLQRLGDPTSKYVNEKICLPDWPCTFYEPSPSPSPVSRPTTPTTPSPGQQLDFLRISQADLRYWQFYSAAARDYVENALTVRVPFFGVAFDVNDLGLLVGIGFVAILLLLRFSLRSEIISLRISFKTVIDVSDGESKILARFYDLLAMRQVLTLPQLRVDKLSNENHGRESWSSHENSRSIWILRAVPKLIAGLPFLVYTLVAWHDVWSTGNIGESIDPDHMKILIAYTIFFWGIIAALSAWCIWKLVQIDLIWDCYWSDTSGNPPEGLHARYVKGLREIAERKRPKTEQEQ